MISQKLGNSLRYLNASNLFPIRNKRKVDKSLFSLNYPKYFHNTLISMDATNHENNVKSTENFPVSENELIGRLEIAKVSSNDDDAIELKESESVNSWEDNIAKSIAKSRKIRGGNYVQLATVDASGRPKCRTVVFRGFVKFPLETENANQVLGLKMITDSRSEKVSQINGQPLGEMVWWFSSSSEQYRLSGELILVDDLHGNQALLNERKSVWGNLSDPAREQFFWNTPGISYTGSSSVPSGGRDSEGKIIQPPPKSFLLMLLVPSEVKYLRLRDNYAQIDRLVDSEWIPQRINP
jgi:PPOX class probable FMN-dependent enzyme